jgi:signal transduction histidine kinase
MPQPPHHIDQLTILTSLARIATATRDVEQMLTEIARRLREGLGAQHVELFLLDEAAGELTRAAYVGAHGSATSGRRLPVHMGILGRTVRTQQAQWVPDVLADSDYSTCDPATRSELCVPILAGGRVLGLINLESERPDAFGTEQFDLLATTTDIVAGALEHARLNRRAQEAAVLEERNRLARELHDSVTQQLFSITLTAQAARVHLEKNPERAAAQLERLQETAAAALAEMRALIGQLRPPALTDQGLVSALQQHIAALSRREGLRIELRVTGNQRLAHGCEQALYRITQEALNNIVKHAQASNVRVALDFAPEQVRLQIADDGIGFDVAAQDAQPTVPAERHLGLMSMRERAAEIGGTLTLRSARGGGTDVQVTVPRT